MLELFDAFDDSEKTQWLSIVKSKIFDQHFPLFNTPEMYAAAHLSQNNVLFTSMQHLHDTCVDIENRVLLTGDLRLKKVLDKLQELKSSNALLYKSVSKFEVTTLVPDTQKEQQKQQRVVDVEEDIVDDESNKNKKYLKCPLANCDGVVSKDFYCLKCFTKFCSECFTKHDKTQQKCKDDDIEHFKYLMRCKNCPKCRNLCHKESGCDHVKCMTCGCCFNWSNLAIRGFGKKGDSNPYGLDKDKQSVHKYLKTDIDGVIIERLNDVRRYGNIDDDDVAIDVIIAQESLLSLLKKKKSDVSLSSKKAVYSIYDTQVLYTKIMEVVNKQQTIDDIVADIVDITDTPLSLVERNNRKYWSKMTDSLTSKCNSLEKEYTKIYYKFILGASKSVFIDLLYKNFAKILLYRIVQKTMRKFLNYECDKEDALRHMNACKKILGVNLPFKHLDDRSGWKGNPDLDLALTLKEMRL